MNKCLLVMIIAISVFLGSSCVEIDDYAHVPEKVNGYSPVYMAEVDLISQIQSLPPRVLKNTGRVYLYRTYMLVIEKDSGIHVLDNNSPSLESLGFIQIPYINSFSIKDDVLYAQFGFGLMYIDIAQYPTIKVLGTLKTPGANSYINFDQLREKANNTWGTIYFDCPDESNKIVIDWVPKVIKKPKCFIQ